jgi:hypothetical protein
MSQRPQLEPGALTASRTRRVPLYVNPWTRGCKDLLWSGLASWMLHGGSSWGTAGRH